LSDTVIEARDLRKQYGALEAVAGIDFEVVRGECFGFLGPNGAGKSTTMRMLYRATPVDSGTLRILDLDVGRGRNDRLIKRRLGVVPQEYNLDERLSARENLQVFARFYGLYGKAAARRVDELLGFVGLEDRPDAPIVQLSGGQKRRVQIARGLLGSPEILVLDEPTTGLDPTARHALWERLVDLKRRDVTLVLTTHYMDEAEKLCDRLVIMDRGRIVAEGSPAALIAAYATSHVVELRIEDEAELERVEAVLADGARRCGRLAQRLLLYTDDGEGLIRRVVHDHPELVATLRHSNLEDVFLEITGRGLGEDAGPKG
jgi:lipooligosaccharide transport system ATP-binding protein